MNYASYDDETLIRFIVSSKAEALNVLYDRYSRLVFSMALHATGEPGVAEEITQDVFMRIWEKAETYRADQAKVSTWLTSITRYRIIDVLRRRSVRPEQNSVGWEEITANATPSTTDSPEEIAEQTMSHRRVRRAIASLPVEQRRTLALAYFYGLTHSEIAERLNEPLGTVKTRIRLAMQKLRELLRDDLPVSR